MNGSFYEYHVIENADLPFFMGVDKVVTEQTSSLLSNWHENIEILHCIEGEGHIVLNGEIVPISSGETVVANSNVIHSARSDTYMMYYYLIIDKTFCLDNGINTDSVCFAKRFVNHEVTANFHTLANKFRCKENIRKDPFAVAKIRKCVLSILVSMCENNLDNESLPENSNLPGLQRIEQAIMYVNNHYTEKITLDDVSMHTGMSKFYLSREFKTVTGFTIVAYINTLRCKLARDLIKRGFSVSDAAEKSGFENMSYFTKTFKRYVGNLPSDFARDNRILTVSKYHNTI